MVNALAIALPQAGQKRYPIPAMPDGISPALREAIDRYAYQYDAGGDATEWDRAASDIALMPAAGAAEQALKLLHVLHYMSPEGKPGSLTIDLSVFDVDGGHMLVAIAADMMRAAAVSQDTAIERDWSIIRTGMRLAEDGPHAPDSEEFQFALSEAHAACDRILDARPATIRAAIVQILCGMWADACVSAAGCRLSDAVLAEDLDQIEALDAADGLEMHQRFALRAIRTLQRSEGAYHA